MQTKQGLPVKLHEARDALGVDQFRVRATERLAVPPITLEVGGLNEEVTVSGDASPVNTSAKRSSLWRPASARASGVRAPEDISRTPSITRRPSGCEFHTRCPYAIQACKEVVPPLAEIKPNHFAACIRISPDQPDIEKVAPGEAPGLKNPGRVIAQ